MAYGGSVQVPLQWVGAAVLFAGALAVPLSLGITPDVSWLLTVAERVLSGETLYRDILEYNPPFSVWIYMGPALLAGATGLTAEWLLVGQFAVLFAASFATSSVMLVRSGCVRRDRLWLFLIAWICAFVLLPNSTFLQREHFAVVAVMPWLALQAARWHGAAGFRPAGWMLAVAGVSCAAMVMTKPYYLATVLFPVLGLALKTRSVRPLFHAENLVGAALTVTYGLVVIGFYPAFFDFLYPTLKTNYLPVRTPETTAFFLAFAGAVVAAYVLMARPDRWPALSVAAVLAACGHFAGVVVMGKAFTYHVLPAFALFAIGFMVLAATVSARGRLLTGGKLAAISRQAVSVVLVGTTVWLVCDVYRRGGVTDMALVRHLKTNHAGQTFVSISPGFTDSHPLVRLAGGSYVGPHGAMLAADYGNKLIRQEPDMGDERIRAIRAEIDRERAIYADAILRRRPDVLLVSDRADRDGDSAWRAISRANSDGSSIGQLYEYEAKFGEVAVYLLR